MSAQLPYDQLATPGAADSPLASFSDDPLVSAKSALDVTENEDGSAEVAVPEAAEAEAPEFYANLAEHLEEAALQTIATDLITKVELDLQARSLRDTQYAEGIRRSGLDPKAPGGADFEGASRATHPMIVESCVDFAASAMRELLPPDGPVKEEIRGDPTPDKQRVAERQRDGLNWALMEWVPEYADALEQTMTQVPLGGSQYEKFWWDTKLRRLTTQFVPVDDYILPFAATSFYSAERRTHVQHLTALEFDERIASGFYREVPASKPAMAPEPTKAEAAAARVEGKEDPGMNEDGLRNVYEVDCLYELDIDNGEVRPYLISVDKETNRVVSIYRNWEEKDASAQRIDWVVEYGFLFWRGALKIGIYQLIGQLSIAATGALRALLDSAHVNNAPTAATLKGTKLSGQSTSLGVCQVTEIESSVTGVQDIRALMMPLPFNPPSQVLAWLLGWLTEQAKGVVTTAEEKIADAGANMPVGTALALIEQGSKVMRAIHARLHRSQRSALKIIKRILTAHAEEFEAAQKQLLGEVLVSAQELRQPLAVSPVSDPNIFSEGQRYAQNQLLLQLAIAGSQTGVKYDMFAVHRRLLVTAKIPNIDEVLPEPKGPTELNAAAENISALMGQQIQAFPEQDHLAHLETHLRFALDPFLGGAPAAQPLFVPRIIENLKQHVAFFYAKNMHDATGSALGQDVAGLFKQPNGGAQVDRLIAAASKAVHAATDHALEPLSAPLEQLLQIVQAMKPDAPMDPIEAALAETARRAQRDHRELDLREANDGAERALEGLGFKVQARGQDMVQAVNLAKVREERRKNEAANRGRLPDGRGGR